MNAPKKIYISHCCHEEGFEYAWYYSPLPNRRHEEYIHKDALLEWANMMLKVSASLCEETAYEELIKQINSL